MLPFAFAAFIEAISSVFFLFGYVYNDSSFPKPLTSEEESELIKLMNNGDMDARNKLIEKNMRLVAYVAKNYSMDGNDFEDLISVGTIGLIKAISTFDATKGIKLVSYAAKCIENEIRMHLRKATRYKNEISLHDPVGCDKDGNETTLMDLLENDSQSVFDEVVLNIEKNLLHKKMKTVLKKKEKTILEHRYGLLDRIRKTQVEVAQMLGISRSYVSRIENRAIKKLSKVLNV